MSHYMKVIKRDEAGYSSALEGLALNKKQDKDMAQIALKLSNKDYGHNKFMESIYIWLLVSAPRYWWQEASTYRLSTAQSESTLHTFEKEVNQWDLDDIDPDYCMKYMEDFEDGSMTLDQKIAIVQALSIKDPTERLVAIKQKIPEGFIQTRMWCMSYKTLRNIIVQRHSHRLPHWKDFIFQVLEQVDHPELLEV